jgi:hypothetical protein
MMNRRDLVLVGAVGSAVAAATFFVQLDNALTAKLFAQVGWLAAGFGLFMAVWNGPLIHLDMLRRSTRNVVFEHLVAQAGAVTCVAWISSPWIGHLRWVDIALYTIAASISLFFVHLTTRRQISGKDPDEIFP